MMTAANGLTDFLHDLGFVFQNCRSKERCGFACGAEAEVDSSVTS